VGRKNIRMGQERIPGQTAKLNRPASWQTAKGRKRSLKYNRRVWSCAWGKKGTDCRKRTGSSKKKLPEGENVKGCSPWVQRLEGGILVKRKGPQQEGQNRIGREGARIEQGKIRSKKREGTPA